MNPSTVHAQMSRMMDIWETREKVASDGVGSESGIESRINEVSLGHVS